MLNNMLGEEDLNPQGFHRWPVNQRMTSMMSPSLVLQPKGRSIALGSGGSNRIRSAILQVLVNLIDFVMSPDDAVNQPRVHFEAGGSPVMQLEPAGLVVVEKEVEGEPTEPRGRFAAHDQAPTDHAHRQAPFLLGPQRRRREQRQERDDQRQPGTRGTDKGRVLRS